MEDVVSRWTNPSVRALAAGGDPIEAITHRAREVALDALEAGWSGPPFDPMTLADHLKLEILPRQQVRDARTVPTPDGRVHIEFNPNRPVGRLRFSIAHEIAHTLFPDCAAQVRNRTLHEDLKTDDWQLEMLCNIAAAEFLMPTGSFVAELSQTPTTIDEVLKLRRRYDVSVEAVLIRIAKLTTDPIAGFVASRIESGANVGQFRIDYAVPSRHAKWPLRKGAILSADSVVGECRAIGFTAKGTQRVPGVAKPFRLECVGLPPYPGSTFPRVAAILGELPESTAEPNILYLAGNALDPRGLGEKLIVHVVNDRTPNWGGHGFAVQVARRWPGVLADFRAWVSADRKALALGKVRFFRAANGVTIASMVAQRGYGPSAVARLRYSALDHCLAAVAEFAARNSSAVHMPRIGTGYAGGSWLLIEELIRLTLLRAGVPVTVYDLSRAFDRPSTTLRKPSPA